MRRALKRFAWIAGGSLIAICLGLGTVWVGGNTPAGRTLIERLTYRLTAGHVRLTGLGGEFPARPTLRELQLRDAEGVWLTANGVSVQWSPLGLLRRSIRADTVHVDRLSMERAPVSASPGGGAVSIPRIEVARFAVDALELGAPLVGAPATLAARGSLQLRSVEEADVELTARRLGGDGEYILRAHVDPKRIDAAMSVHEPASGPLENLLSLPGLGPLSATLAAAGPRAAVKVDLALDAGDLHGWLRGKIDLEHVSADVAYSLDAPALAPRPDLSWSKAALAGNWHGPLAASTADGTLQLDGLRIAGDTRIERLTAGLTARGGTVSAHAVLGGIEIPGPAPRLLAGDDLILDASLAPGAASRPLELTAAHQLFSLHAHVATAPVRKLGVTTVPQSATLVLTLPEFAPLAALAGQDARGRATLNARLVRGRADALELTADLDAGLRGGTAPWVATLGSHATVALAGRLSDGELDLSNLRFSANGLNLTASGSAARTAAVRAPAGVATPHATVLADYIKSLRLRWQLDVADLAALSGNLAGDLRMSGQLAGEPAALEGEASISTRLAVRGSAPGELEVDVHARGLPQAPSGTIRAHGVIDGAPLDIDATLDRGGGAYRAIVRRADWKNAHVEGDLTADAALTQSHGALRLHLGQLEDFDRLLGTHLAGSVDGNVALLPAQGHTRARFELDGIKLVAFGFAGDVHVRAAGDADAVGIKLNAQLPELHGAAATVSADGMLNLQARRLDLERVTADYRGASVRLLAPAAISFADGIRVDDLKIGAADGVVELAGRLAPTFDLRASIDHVDPTLVNLVAPGLLAGGTLEGRARLEGSPSAPTGELRLDARDVRFADDAAAGLPALELHADAELAGGGAAINATLTGGTGSKLTLTGRAPLDADAPLDLKIGGKLDLGLVNPLLEARGLRAAGGLAVDATVTGSSAAPVVGGGITLSAGSLRDYARGVNLSNIEAQIVGNQAGLQIKSFSATAVSGSVGMSGTLGVLQPGMPLDLSITAKNAQPVASNILTAHLDAALRVRGTLRERLDVTGKVHVIKATIGIPNSMPPDVAVLDVRRRGAHAPATDSRQLVIGIDVAIEAPQEILVQGRNLDAELGGEIHLSGTSAEPLASGGFDLQRGSFTLAGSRLNFTQGRVGFDGAGLTKKIDPTLDFTAQATLAETTVTLRITGVADAPHFEFTSSPPLPQDEIMAELLFGEKASQLTAIQVAEIGAALATVSGVGSGNNPLAKLQKSLGLDRLSVGGNTTTTATGTENSGAAIAAGRYLTRRVYVEGKQTTTGTSQVQVDVDLTKHLKLQTRLGNGTATTQGTTPENDPGSSIGLSYQFEY